MKSSSDGRLILKSNLLTVAVIAVICVSVIALAFIGNGYAEKTSLQDEKGYFDLAGVNFDGGDRVYLNGNWEYYEGQFIVSDGLENPSITSSVFVPYAYSRVLDSQQFTNSTGYASYRCTIKNVAASDYLTIYIPSIACPYRIFINNISVTESGSVDRISENMWSNSTHEGIPFLLESSGEYNIVIELCGKNNAILSMPVKLANNTYDNLYRSRDAAFRFVMCGIVATSAFIFIILKRFANRDLYSLWLPVLCFVLLVRMLFTGESYFVIQSFLFNISFEDIGLMSFAATFIIKLISLVYITKCLKIKTADNVFVAFSATFLLLALAISFVPNSIFDIYYFTILQLLSSIIDIYLINKLCIEIVRKTEDALLYLLSYVFMLVGIIIDVLYSNGAIHVNCSAVMPTCFLLFVAFTAVIHTRRISKIFSFALDAQRLETELERANNSIMLSQIQPHFMYNALNTIKSLIKRDPPKAEQAVIDFSMYLRGNMDSLTKVDPIPFSEELEHIKHYCNIELLRFQDKLDVFYEIGPEDFYVPTLSVQPIVENAIKHGVTKRPEGGSVTISTDEDEKNYYIVVEDDGVGFDVNSIAKREDPKRSHVGIKNISERLKLIMGADVVIESVVGTGSRVTVKLPKDRNVKTLQESLELNERTNALKEMEI